MPSLEVVVKVEDAGGTPVTELPRAWVYWLDAGQVKLLRTDDAGRLRALGKGGDPTQPWAYTDPFLADSGAATELCVTRGSRPVLATRIQERPDLRVKRTVTGTPGAPMATIGIPAATLEVSRPADLSVWPVLWEAPSPTYSTMGLDQASALWGKAKAKAKQRGKPTLRTPPVGGSPGAEAQPPATPGLKVTENSRAPAPPDAVRPRERAVFVEGTVDAKVSAVKIQVIDVAGKPVALLADPRKREAKSELLEMDAAFVDKGSGGKRAFSAKLYFARTAEAFGPVQVLARTEGLTPNVIGVASCLLTGVQIALVADPADGKKAGLVGGETDEKIIVDFLESPKKSVKEITAQTRARRMAVFDQGIRNRPASGRKGANSIPTPEMPLWMAELHLLGLTAATVTDLLNRRQNAGASARLAIQPQWRLRLFWDGPDSGPLAKGKPPDRRYSYGNDFPQDTEAKQEVTVSAPSSSGMGGPAGGPQLSVQVSPQPETIPFPVEGRRKAQVRLQGEKRRWGRQANGTVRDAIVVEWQPNIARRPGPDPVRDVAKSTKAGSGGGDPYEVLRGGDGEILLRGLLIDGAPVGGEPPPKSEGGKGSPTKADDGAGPPDKVKAGAASSPVAALPVFRVRGKNLPVPKGEKKAPAVAEIVNSLVEEYFRAHKEEARIKVLSLARWQATVRAIIDHESGGGSRHFDDRGAARRKYAKLYYGHERDMPLFGAPHGYGLGQLDNPPPESDQVWSFIANLRSVVELIMGNGRDDKGRMAYSHLKDHLHHPATEREAAVYQRELVRCYNGGNEFVWEKGDWQILTRPTTQPKYPNQVFKDASPVTYVAVTVRDGGSGKEVTRYKAKFEPKNYGPEK
jgi:hypothetical protein